MESLRKESVPQALTGDVVVHPFATRTVPAIRMDVMGSMLQMEVQDFVPQGTILDVCVVLFADRRTVNAQTTAVQGRTEFALRGALLAAIVIINNS